MGMARALWVRRPGGRYRVAVRGHDRKAIFRRQSALVNAKGALQRLPGPAASELLSRAAVGNHRPNWTPVPTRPPAAPRAAFKSQRDFVSQPKVGAPAPTLGQHPTIIINPNGVAAMRYAFIWPRLHHLTPHITPPNSQPAWHRTPAPAARHHCRKPNQIIIFSPIRAGISRATRKPLSLLDCLPHSGVSH